MSGLLKDADVRSIFSDGRIAAVERWRNVRRNASGPCAAWAGRAAAGSTDAGQTRRWVGEAACRRYANDERGDTRLTRDTRLVRRERLSRRHVIR